MSPQNMNGMHITEILELRSVSIAFGAKLSFYIAVVSNWLQNPYYFMCVNLVHPSDDSRVYTPHHPALAGQIVSAMYRLKDVNNQGMSLKIIWVLQLPRTWLSNTLLNCRWWLLCVWRLIR